MKRLSPPSGPLPAALVVAPKEQPAQRDGGRGGAQRGDPGFNGPSYYYKT